MQAALQSDRIYSKSPHYVCNALHVQCLTWQVAQARCCVAVVCCKGAQVAMLLAEMPVDRCGLLCRFSYCALLCLSLLDRMDAINVPKAVEFLVACRNFDGGFGCTPGESCIHCPTSDAICSQVLCRVWQVLPGTFVPIKCVKQESTVCCCKHRDSTEHIQAYYNEQAQRLFSDYNRQQSAPSQHDFTCVRIPGASALRCASTSSCMQNSDNLVAQH